MYAYLVYTVNSWRITNEFVEYGDSADEVADRVYAKGYRRVEVAPAGPVNGFKNLPYKTNDTAERGK